MKWVPAEQYTVKIEGVELAGYRALTICGTRDPLLIGRFDDWIETVRQEVETKAANFGVEPSEYELMFHVYGRNGVMAEREPMRAITSPELGKIGRASGRDRVCQSE